MKSRFVSISADFVGRTNSCDPQSRPSLKKNWLFMLQRRTELKIAPYEAKFQTATPKGRQTQGKNRIRPNKCVFAILSFNNFVFSKQKTKLLDDKISKTHFFSSNSIFSLRPSPQRGSQFDDSASNRPILSPVRPNVIIVVVVAVVVRWRHRRAKRGPSEAR